MNREVIYLDYAATTPMDPAVRDAMLPYLGEAFGNPSSVHQVGQDARRALDRARDRVATSINADSSEIYFMSGGTEADNSALLGVMFEQRNAGRNHLIVTTIEHHAVLDTARYLETKHGFDVTYVGVDRWGKVDLEVLKQSVTDRTGLVSVMHANNEIGTIQPIAEIARIAHERGAYFHTDAVQTFGQMPLDVEALGVDLLSLSAHKIYGPKGTGILYVRRGVPWSSLLHGGQQERERRAGTENVAGIVGMGKAVELLPTWREQETRRLTILRDDFIQAVVAQCPGSQWNGHLTERLPNNVNLSFPKVDGETLLLSLDLQGIAASSGSACASGSIEPSHVLLALGLPLAQARSAVRFSLGRGTTMEQLMQTIAVLQQIIG